MDCPTPADLLWMATMSNLRNLAPPFTRGNAREMGRRGGLASARARRAKAAAAKTTGVSRRRKQRRLPRRDPVSGIFLPAWVPEPRDDGRETRVVFLPTPPNATTGGDIYMRLPPGRDGERLIEACLEAGFECEYPPEADLGPAPMDGP